MAKREIMVVSRKKLFRNSDSEYFTGFKEHAENSRYDVNALKYREYLEREKAEQSIYYKQPIAYTIIVNPDIKKAFIYQRAKKDMDYGEKRLQGKWSIGIGGHIDKATDGDSTHPINHSFIRELNEELRYFDRFSGWESFKPIGYINDESDSVGKVHFGMVYIIETGKKRIIPRDKEIACGKMRTVKEIEKILSLHEAENWTKIAFPALKNYISSL